MADLSQLVTRIASALQITHDEASALAQRIAPVLIVDAIETIGDSADAATRYCIASEQVTSAVLLPTCRLQNRALSGTRMIVEGVTITSLVAGVDFFAGIIPITLQTTQVASQFRDGVGGTPVGVFEATEVVAATLPDWVFRLAANEPYELPGSFVIEPAFELQVQSDAQAASFHIGWRWREIKRPQIV